MQESSCNPNTVGGAGEQGLMQLTPNDKCGGAPGGNCKEPAYNIGTGARFFSGLIKDNGGNVLKAVGKYNGWVQGMTVGSATRMKNTCCRCQNNLDYVCVFGVHLGL
jgi:soluble lytic murein transglycosylase-like protein